MGRRILKFGSGLRAIRVGKIEGHSARMARRVLIGAHLDHHANQERMRDVKTRALEVMLRCRIVAPASSNLVSRIVSEAAGMKQIEGARLTGKNPQLRSQQSKHSIQKLKNQSSS